MDERILDELWNIKMELIRLGETEIQLLRELNINQEIEQLTHVLENQARQQGIMIFAVACLGIIAGAIIGKAFISQWKPGV